MFYYELYCFEVGKNLILCIWDCDLYCIIIFVFIYIINNKVNKL